MLETIIKRNGEREPFQANKTNGWMVRMGRDVTDRMDWSSIVIEARNSAPSELSSQEWQLQLITLLKTRGSQDDGWPYMVMAGGLYTAYLMKKIHGDHYPKLKDMIDSLVAKGLMRDMGYTDDEIEYLDTHVIDHAANDAMNWTQVEQYNLKYSLRDFVTKQTYETPQFTHMRMAMAIFEHDAPYVRIEKVAEQYREFRDDVLNPPSPNYSALGTPHFGMASCCLIYGRDTAASIQAAGDVAYSMTLASGGIGMLLSTRAPGDPVDGGRVNHAGRRNYINKFVGDTCANKQGARGGAITVYDTCFSPEIELNIMMQNPRTPVELRERRLNVSYLTNSLFIRKAANREKYFTFTEFSAPDLYKAFFSADQSLFEELYAKYEADPDFKKDYRDAYQTVAWIGGQEIEQSTLFWGSPQEMNRHTSFKGPLHQSNLCVAPETTLMTDKGDFPIVSLVGQTVTIWNGQEWSDVEVVKTGENQKVVTVTLSDGKSLDSTEYHKWYIQDEGAGGFIEVRTHELLTGMTIIDFVSPDGEEVMKDITITSIEDKGRICDTYCVTEPKRHMAVFNGILTGQCMEVVVRTEPWKNVQALYDERGLPENGETGMCNIGSIPIHRLPFNPSNPKLGYERYKRAVRAMMNVIDYAIDNSEYHFPAIRTQAKSRRNCSVGMSGVATLFAQLNLKHNSPEGLRVWHILNERHMYACIEVALEMGIERGNAPWINGPNNDGVDGTKWVDGWMPIDTYKKEIDQYVDSTLCFDWEDLRSRVVANKGIRFSSLVAHMPGEQATRKGTGSNSVYLLQALSVDLSDGTSAMPWAAMDNDLIGDQYQLAWDLTDKEHCIRYGICQKFTDQAISADRYEDRRGNPPVESDRMVQKFIDRVHTGMKTSYYVRSLTEQGGKQEEINLVMNPEPLPEVAAPVDDVMARIAAQAAAMMADSEGAMSCTMDGACGA